MKRAHLKAPSHPLVSGFCALKEKGRYVGAPGTLPASVLNHPRGWGAELGGLWPRVPGSPRGACSSLGFSGAPAGGEWEGGGGEAAAPPGRPLAPRGPGSAGKSSGGFFGSRRQEWAARGWAGTDRTDCVIARGRLSGPTRRREQPLPPSVHCACCGPGAARALHDLLNSIRLPASSSHSVTVSPACFYLSNFVFSCNHGRVAGVRQVDPGAAADLLFFRTR